jgi:hypothetical protein
MTPILLVAEPQQNRYGFRNTFFMMPYMKLPGIPRWPLSVRTRLSYPSTTTALISSTSRSISNTPGFNDGSNVPHVVRRPLNTPDNTNHSLVRRTKVAKTRGDRDILSRDALVQRNGELFRVSEEVQAAIRDNKPVVALESTIYTHGFPSPQNYSLALNLEDTVRRLGAVPATIAILNGKACVGLSREEIMVLCSAQSMGHDVMKVSRRDLPYILSKVRYVSLKQSL